MQQRINKETEHRESKRSAETERSAKLLHVPEVIFKKYGVKLDVTDRKEKGTVLFRWQFDSNPSGLGTNRWYEAEMGHGLIDSMTPDELEVNLVEWLKTCGLNPDAAMQGEPKAKRKRIRMGKWRIKRELV